MYKNKIKHKQQERKGTVLIKISSVFFHLLRRTSTISNRYTPTHLDTYICMYIIRAYCVASLIYYYARREKKENTYKINRQGKEECYSCTIAAIQDF